MNSVHISPVLKLAIVFTLIVLLGAGAYLSYTNSNYFTSKTSNDSPFTSLINDSSSKAQVQRVKLSDADLANIAKFEEMLRLPFSEGQNESLWSWETDMFLGEVRLVEKDRGVMYIRIQNATDQAFNRKTLPMQVSCTLNEVVIYNNNNMTRVDAGVDIFEYASQGDMIYAYCDSSECKSIDRLCALIDKRPPTVIPEGEPSNTPKNL